MKPTVRQYLEQLLVDQYMMMEEDAKTIVQLTTEKESQETMGRSGRGVLTQLPRDAGDVGQAHWQGVAGRAQADALRPPAFRVMKHDTVIVPISSVKPGGFFSVKSSTYGEIAFVKARVSPRTPGSGTRRSMIRPSGRIRR